MAAQFPAVTVLNRAKKKKKVQHDRKTEQRILLLFCEKVENVYR